MRFDPITAEDFERFHAAFAGDTPEFFAVCAKCGGACEYNKIGTLMPGEREYMAEKAQLSVSEFSERYLDILITDDGVELDVLKLVDGCPFLDRTTYECACRTFKVVLCDIFPIGFRVQDERVVFFVDEWCPLADTARFRRHFEKVGIPAVSRLPVLLAWYHCVEQYDHLYFDYKAIEAARKNGRRCETFSMQQLLTFQRRGMENDPRERYHPYPDEVSQVPAEPATNGIARCKRRRNAPNNGMHTDGYSATLHGRR